VGRPLSEWLENGAALLSEPDPGPTPFLVKGLVVDPSILAVVGREKVGKTWAVLELAVSVATGLPAFGRIPVRRGPVVLVLEESGRKALHRRLLAICRGRGIDPRSLSEFHYAANQRVSLALNPATTDPRGSWQRRIKAAVAEIRPALVLFDPLARMKGAIDENVQHEMAEILEFMRELRDAGDCTVGFVHHTPHTSSSRMRGSSDFESVWESKVTIERKASGSTLTAEHRESESTGTLSYQMVFEGEEVRLELDGAGRPPAIRDEILAYLREHPESTRGEIEEGLRRNRQRCRSELSALIEARNVIPSRSRRPDKNGTLRPVDVFSVSADAGMTPFQPTQNGSERDDPGTVPFRGSHTLKGGNRTEVRSVNGNGRDASTRSAGPNRPNGAREAGS
jgi:hypothetical protein